MNRRFLYVLCFVFLTLVSLLFGTGIKTVQGGHVHSEVAGQAD